MMKSVFAISFLFSLSAFSSEKCASVKQASELKCKASQVITNIGCENQSLNQLRCTSTFTSKEMNQYLIGQIVDHLSGELDSQVLGEGTLIHLQTKEGSVVILEPLTNGLLDSLKSLSNVKNMVVGVSKESLVGPGRRERRVMKQIAQEKLQAPQDATYLEILD